MNWWWATVLGPVVLGVAMAYALITRRKLNPAEKEAQKRAIRRAYEEPGPPK